MAEYNSPGVYVEDLPSSSITIQGVTTSIAAFVGVTKRGDASSPQYITSWTAFKNTFAYGLDSAFYKNSYLAFAVYSFFLNRGTKCYVQRAGTSKLARATASVLDGGNTKLALKAKDEGAWANGMKWDCKANADVPNTFDVTITVNGDTETHLQLSNDESDEKYFIDYLAQFSNYVQVVTGTLSITASSVTFAGGDDGEDAISDNDFIAAMNKLDAVDDYTLLAVPGQTSIGMLTAIIDFADNHPYVFAALDAPQAYTTTELKALRKQITCKKAVLLSSWHRVVDPLSNVSGKYRAIPSSGGYLGVVARTIEKIGVWKAPAGTDAKINGAIDLVFSPNKGDTDILNPLGIVSIISKPNFGIVVWGARTIGSDSNYIYVSSIILSIYIKKSVEEGTQTLVFDPNKGTGVGNLWSKNITACESFLDVLWRSGGLKGASAKEAYYVKCDEELNPDSITDRGICITEVGYAEVKPAEFLVFRFTNKVNTSE